MDSEYYTRRIEELEAERNKIVNDIQPGLGRLSFLEGILQTLKEMQANNNETIKRLEVDNAALRAMADMTLGGTSTGTPKNGIETPNLESA